MQNVMSRAVGIGGFPPYLKKRKKIGRRMEKEREDDNGRSGVQSVETAAAVLRAMTEIGRPASLKDLALGAQMHPAKVHRYLVSLVRSELVTQDPTSGYYGVGPMAVALGLAGLRNVNVVREAASVLTSVRDETGETALLALWTGSAPVVFMLEESSRPVFMNIRVGSVLPLIPTASGRVFAAFRSSAEIDPLLKREAKAASPRHAPLYKQSEIEKTLASVRDAGIAAVDGSLVPGVCAVAAPIFDHRGRIAAVIGSLGRSDEMDASVGGVIATCLRNAGLSVSARIGFR